MRLGGLQSRSGRVGEDIHSITLVGNRTTLSGAQIMLQKRSPHCCPELKSPQQAHLT